MKFYSIPRVFFITLLFVFLFYAFLAGPYWLSLFKYHSVAGSGVDYVVPGSSRVDVNFEETTTLRPASIRFGVVIPRLGINKTVSANVDLYDSSRMNGLLENNLVHMAGSALPSRIGTVVILGHSLNQLLNFTHANPEMYLLKKLEAGDTIYLYHEMVEYTYKVTGLSFREPTYFDFFTPTRVRKLVLVSGWPPGTSLRLLLVEAEATWD